MGHIFERGQGTADEDGETRWKKKSDGDEEDEWKKQKKNTISPERAIIVAYINSSLE